MIFIFISIIIITNIIIIIIISTINSVIIITNNLFIIIIIIIIIIIVIINTDNIIISIIIIVIISITFILLLLLLLLLLLPAYLYDRLSIRQTSESLRSSNSGLFLHQPVSSNPFLHRSFSNIALHLWNSLPLNVRLSPFLKIFRKRLKTHLYSQISFS